MIPDWLAEVVRPRAAPPPWPDMIRAAFAICVPLSVGFAVGNDTLGVLPAMGGLLGTVADTGGSHVYRVKRVSYAALCGGAVGLAIGSVIHGHGWLAVVALVVVAGVSGVLTTLGDIGSAVGMQLLVYATLATGPLGAQRPVWHTVVGFLVGVAWALALILPGWLLSPYGEEQRDVAAVYLALAAALRSIGSDRLTSARQALTAALNTAYDTLLQARTTATGQSGQAVRLVAVLNASHLMAEAAAALSAAGSRPPPQVIVTVERLADSIRNGTPPPTIPMPWDESPGTLALRDGLAGAARVLSGDWSPEHRTREGLRDRRPDRRWAARLGERLARTFGELAEAFGGGTLSRTFTIRLMICIGAAGVVTEVLPLQRSYWVPLTVAIVLRPDFGSVFARALQRGIGTVVGAVIGAALLVLMHGTWLLIPFAVLAALLPYGRSKNYGLFSTFLTPLVVLLIDLLVPVGWRLAEDRLIDTLLGCAIALVIGFAPWPMSWYAQLPRQFGLAAQDVCRYMRESLLDSGETGQARGLSPAARSRLRRSTYRTLSDLRAEFQRTISEPAAISHRAAGWWPAVVALENVMDAVTGTVIAVSRGAGSAGSSTEPLAVPAAGVQQLCAALHAVSEAATEGTALRAPAELPDDEVLKPITEAVRVLLGVLGSGQRLSVR